MSAWIKLFDPASGCYYYCDTSTGHTTWDTPDECKYGTAVEAESLSGLKWQVPGRTERMQFAQLRQLYLRDKAENIAFDQEMARREAERKEQQRQDEIWSKRIDEAKTTLHLNISWEKLKLLPDAVYDMQRSMPVGQYLLALRLIGQGMEELPTSVCTVLVGLRVLSLSHNQIAHLPPEVANLQELRDLNVTNNKLTALPENLGHLQQLRRLDVSGNQIQRLPDSFAALTGLRHLRLEFNRLSLLPENLHLMSLVTRINASDNRLTRLPRCLSLMPKLHTFIANNNLIGYIPQNITQSPRLRNLKLCNNKIKLIPDAVADWSNLRNLWLDSNFISTLPMNFYQLTHLESLKLENNRTLLHPPQEVLDGGLEAVLRWCADRYHHQDAHRKRYLIRSMQEVLQQIAALDVADPAHFQADVPIRGDLWFAFDWAEFWRSMLPALRKRCEALADMGVEVSSVAMAFSANEHDIRWAFKGYFDAYGAMMQDGMCMFRRCACVDKQGNPKPCEPPSTGFACYKEATLIKKYIVLKRHRQEREWRQQKIEAIREAEVVAEKHARNYLSSKEGSLYIKQLAFQKAETILHEQTVGKILSIQEAHQQAREQKLAAKRAKLIPKLTARLEELQARKGEIEQQLKELNGNQHLEEELRGLYVRINEVEKQIRNNTKPPPQQADVPNEDADDDGSGDEKQADQAIASRAVDKVWQMIELRFRKLMSTFSGRFSELQVQFELELKAMYIDYQIKLARRTTEREWNVLQDVRDNWLGQGVAAVFRSWKMWVRSEVKQRRRDRREQLKLQVNEWNTYQASLDIANMRLNQWTPMVDPLSDHTYWFNEATGASTWTQPVLSDFLPPNFDQLKVPERPPADAEISSSSESSSGSSSDFDSDWDDDSDNESGGDSSESSLGSSVSTRSRRRRSSRKRPHSSQSRNKRGRINRNRASHGGGTDQENLDTTRSTTTDALAHDIRERQYSESDRAFQEVLRRRQRSKLVKHQTYLAQRRAKPKAYREHLSRLAELENGGSAETAAEIPEVVNREVLARMVGFDGEHSKYSLDDYTRFASKAVAIQNRHLQQTGKIKKQSRIRQFLEPLWKADEVVIEDDASDS